jgi:hypothetical protein
MPPNAVFVPVFHQKLTERSMLDSPIRSGPRSPFKNGSAKVARGERAVGTSNTLRSIFRAQSRISSNHGKIARPTMNERLPAIPKSPQNLAVVFATMEVAHLVACTDRHLLRCNLADVGKGYFTWRTPKHLPSAILRAQRCWDTKPRVLPSSWLDEWNHVVVVVELGFLSTTCQLAACYFAVRQCMPHDHC